MVSRARRLEQGIFSTDGGTKPKLEPPNRTTCAITPSEHAIDSTDVCAEPEVESSKTTTSVELVSDKRWGFWGRTDSFELWKAVMLSIGLVPTTANRKKLLGEPTRMKRAYINRLNLAKGSYTVDPRLQSLNHPEEGEKTEDKYVLLPQFVEYVKEKNWPRSKMFLAQMSNINYAPPHGKNKSGQKSPESEASAVSKLGVIEKPIASKRNQEKGNATKQNERYDILIYALAKSAFKYQGTESAKDCEGKIEDMVKEIKEYGYLEFGLGKDALKTILKRAYKTIDAKKLGA